MQVEPVLQRLVDESISAAADIDWSISIRDSVGNELVAHNAGASLNTASVGKLLLLAEVARQCEVGTLDSAEPLTRDPALLVADSGIWQYLRVEQLSIHDLCVLVAAVSDNLATNVLLKHVGLQRIKELSGALGMRGTALLDYVRDARGPDDEWALSVGTAAELSRFMTQMASGQLISPFVSYQLDSWLATGTDLSMVASAFGFDPLAHAQPDRGYSVRSKTGTDVGVRADIGAIGPTGRPLSYAVIANWDAAESDLRDVVLVAMRSIGVSLRDTLQRQELPTRSAAEGTR